VRRREFITLLGGAAAGWPLAAGGQQMARLPTVGFLGAGSPATADVWLSAFTSRLPELGWIEDRNIKIVPPVDRCRKEDCLWRPRSRKKDLRGAIHRTTHKINNITLIVDLKAWTPTPSRQDGLKRVNH
jgi:hypothetical protein